MAAFLLGSHCGETILVASVCQSLGHFWSLEDRVICYLFFLILLEEKVWPPSAEKVGILTLLIVCDELQKTVRERHLFVLDEETVGWVFPLFNTVNC